MYLRAVCQFVAHNHKQGWKATSGEIFESSKRMDTEFTTTKEMIANHNNWRGSALSEALSVLENHRVALI